MASVRRDDFTENMKKTAYGFFWEAYEQKAPVYENIFDVVDSDAA